MKAIQVLSFFIFCLSLSADEFPFPPDSKSISVKESPLGGRIAIWEEKGRILASEMPFNGNWSMPVVLSSAMTTTASPKLKINDAGEVTVTWVENDRIKGASKRIGGNWDFSLRGAQLKNQSDFAINAQKEVAKHRLNEEFSLHTEERKIKRNPPFPKGEGKAFANAIDAPTSAVLSGAQIGFSAGTGAPSNGLTVSGQSLFRTSSNFTGGSLEIGGADRISFAIGGTKTSTDGSSQTGMFLNPTFTPASSTSIVTNVLSYPQFSPAMGVTITKGANFYLQTGGQGGAGAVTNGYNLYVENAGFGTNRYGAYIGGKVGIVTLTPLNNLDVSGAVAIGGYAGSNTAPSNGLIVSGKVGMATATPQNNLDVNGGVAIGSYAGSNTAPSGGLIVSGQTVLGSSTAFSNAELSVVGSSYAVQLQGGLVLNWSGSSVLGPGVTVNILSTDYYVAFEGGGFAITYNLPATVPSTGWTCVIKDESGSAATNNITVKGNGQNIDGAATYVINTNYGVVRIYAHGGNQYYTW